MSNDKIDTIKDNANIRITFAESDRIDSFEKELETVLNVLGHPQALVTDLSDVGDFVYMETPEEDEAELKRIGEILGFKVELRTLLVDICEKLHGL